jgi:type 1 glutamine amidotransferase
VHRKLAMAAAVGAALVVVPSASAQGPDTTAPVVNVGTLTPTAAPQRNGGPAASSTSTGNNGWFTQSAPTVLTVTATDDVGVTKLQYSADAGATWVDMTITPGPSVTGTVPFTAEGNNAIRYRALDAAGNVSRGVAAATTLNQASAAGATAVRLQSTNGRAVGDELVIDTGANAETVTIATIVTPPPASPNPNVTLSAPLTKAHAANAAIQVTPFFRTINVPIDTRPATAAWPTGVGTNNRIGHGLAPITPTRTDPTPGSGSPAVRDAWLDGTWVYPLPLDPSQLSLGKHTWTLGITDVAGNGNKVTFTFLVTTSFADIDALLTRYGTAGTIPAATVTSLKASLAAAKASADGGDPAAAVSGLDAFVSQVRSGVSDSKAQNLLVTDAQDVTRQVRGIPDAAAPADLGVTTERYPGQPRHPYVTPAMPVHNPNAKFKVLVIANWTPDFRHPAIEDATVMIQQLGAQYGFDVDLWDQQWPAQSLPDTPFTSAADLAKYAVIIGNSSVAAGNGQFKTNYVMKDGRVVDEQAAFQGYIRNGGGFVALHGADDSMHQWPWYKDFLGGLFVSHPANANGFGTDCGSCYWAEVLTEDGSHPATTAAGKPVKVAVADELYHFDRKPRAYVHPLMLLNEDTYKTAIGVTQTTGPNAALENGDHPISWCSNYDGGREFAQVLGHNWELFMTTPWFRESIYQGILTAGGLKPANCVTHTEVKTQLASLGASGGLTPAAVTAGTASVDAAFTKYMTLTQSGYSSSLSDIQALRALALDPASGDAASRAKVLAKAQELKDWMGVLLGSTSVGGGANGTVPATLSLSLGAPASFGGLTPGVGKTYTASTTATVISTAGDATLSVADPSTTATGRLVNGTFSLAAALQAMATSPLGAGGALANVGGSSAPTNLLTYSGPVSNDPVAITFSQAVGANEALRTGTYSKTLTFTLSTTTP